MAVGDGADMKAPKWLIRLLDWLTRHLDALDYEEGFYEWIVGRFAFVSSVEEEGSEHGCLNVWNTHGLDWFENGAGSWDLIQAWTVEDPRGVV